jgi:uncharacterized phage-associated protein
MIDSVEFAKYLINRVHQINAGRDTPITLSETKLQKLIYICDGFMLAYGIEFISENVRAWNYGPVYPRVHNWASRHKDWAGQCESCDPGTLRAVEEIRAAPLVDSVITTYGVETAQTLSLWTHEPGGPWEKALEKGRGVMNSVIDKNDIRDYFRGLIRETA